MCFVDESESLKVLKTFNGYLSSLGPQIVYLLKCHTHLERISLALLQLLQLDCSSVNILETSAATAGILYSIETYATFTVGILYSIETYATFKCTQKLPNKFALVTLN